MDLCIICDCDDVDIHASVLGVLFNIVAMLGGSGVGVPLDVCTGLQVVRCRKDVFNPLDLADMSQEL